MLRFMFEFLRNIIFDILHFYSTRKRSIFSGARLSPPRASFAPILRRLRVQRATQAVGLLPLQPPGQSDQLHHGKNRFKLVKVILNGSID
jgi:hypothetical protein